MIYLSLGSNLGHRLYHLQCAVELLKKRCLKNFHYSIILETAAILNKNAPSDWNKPFLNMIVSGETDLSPLALLEVLKNIETELGRPAAHEKWAPRIIDIDILLWDGIKMDAPGLVIPHPELKSRDFLHHLLYLMDADTGIKQDKPAAFIRSYVLHPLFVGVVNVTSDSFSDGGRFDAPDKAIAQIYTLASEGASVIEIGAQSTRPGAYIQTPEKEYQQLKPVLEGITSDMTKENIHISIDSFWPEVVRKILEEYKIGWINDVKGDFDDQTLQLIARHGSKFCAMHSLSIPPRRDKVLPSDQNPIDIIKTWGEQSIEKLMKLGFTADNIILDPGIGFGKSYAQNRKILQSVREFKKLGVQIMIGHSRKSFMQFFSSEKAAERDIETIAISFALKENIDFLRVHNIKDHIRFFAAHACFNPGV
jgi:2-amino-4-hydroxy-6-hydroxymethyldihydropteridine diphosphokinase/dihydropteroate synthase